jgi:hypothetical protein
MNKGILRFGFILLGLLAISYLAVILSSRQQARTYYQLVNDSTVYHFYNTALCIYNDKYQMCDYVFERKYLYLPDDDESILNAMAMELGQKGLDSLLSAEDQEFFRKQVHNGRWFVLNPKRLKGKKVIPLFPFKSRDQHDKLMTKFLRQHRCIGMVSVPYFNLDKTIAIVDVMLDVGRMGSGGVFIYKLNKAREWEFYRAINQWESC